MADCRVFLRYIDDVRESVALKLLCDDERDRFAKFIDRRDALRFLAAHASLRKILSCGGSVDPRAWRFTHNEHGKPTLSYESDLRFSISHSGSLVAIAVARGVEVGIDVEPLARGHAILPLAQRYFAPLERQAIQCAAARDRERLAVRYWTLKESAMKAEGVGLARGLSHVIVTLAGDRAMSPGFLLRQWMLDGAYVVAAAAVRGEAANGQIDWIVRAAAGATIESENAFVR
jgi:phosphopantetheine--protein transferase-like protein